MPYNIMGNYSDGLNTNTTTHDRNHVVNVMCQMCRGVFINQLGNGAGFGRQQKQVRVEMCVTIGAMDRMVVGDTLQHPTPNPITIGLPSLMTAASNQCVCVCWIDTVRDASASIVSGRRRLVVASPGLS